MKQHRWFVRILTMAVVCLVSAATATPAIAAPPAPGNDNKAIIRQARAAYYNLRGKGFLKLQCSAAPNWEPVLAEQKKNDPAAYAKAIALLNAVRFNVAVGSTGDAQVTHNDVAAPNDKSAEGMKQVYSGMEQMLSGFFQTWTPFMLSDPFPDADTDYKLEDLGTQYRLTYVETGKSNIETLMGKDFAISEMKVATAEFDSTIRPRFEKTAKGFVLIGYDAEYQGKGDPNTMRLKIGIDNREVNGLAMPSKLDVTVWSGGTTNQIELDFTECKVEKQ
jgi:hypothetical protein